MLNNKHGIIHLIPLVIVGTLILVGTITYNSIQLKQKSDENNPIPTEAATPSSTSELNDSDASQNTTQATPTSTPTATPVPTQTKTPSSTNTGIIPQRNIPATTNIFLRPQDGNVVRNRYVNTFKDTEVVSTHEYNSGNTPNFEPFGNGDELLACILVRSKNTINGSNISFSVIDNGSVISSGFVHNTDVGFQGTNVCQRLPVSAGSHNTTIVYNSDGSIGEDSYTDNTVKFAYTVGGDSDGPQFTLLSVKKVGDQTCINYTALRDNLTPTEKIKLEYFFDGQASESPCISGNKGDRHSFTIRAHDEHGNTTEQSNTFAIL